MQQVILSCCNKSLTIRITIPVETGFVAKPGDICTAARKIIAVGDGFD